MGVPPVIFVRARAGRPCHNASPTAQFLRDEQPPSFARLNHRPPFRRQAFNRCWFHKTILQQKSSTVSQSPRCEDSREARFCGSKNWDVTLNNPCGTLGLLLLQGANPRREKEFHTAALQRPIPQKHEEGMTRLIAKCVNPRSISESSFRSLNRLAQFLRAHSRVIGPLRRRVLPKLAVWMLASISPIHRAGLAVLGDRMRHRWMLAEYWREVKSISSQLSSPFSEPLSDRLTRLKSPNIF